MEKTTEYSTQDETMNANDDTVSEVNEEVNSSGVFEENEPGDTMDLSDETVAEMDEDNFMKLYEESLKSIQEGEVVPGEIVQVEKDFPIRSQFYTFLPVIFSVGEREIRSHGSV